MARLIIFGVIVLGLALAVASVMMAITSFTSANPAPKGNTMPKTFSTIAYVLLIVLMFGVTTGWLGAA